MAVRRFAMREDGSDKFWDVERIDATVTVHWGRTGTKGRRLEKSFPDAGAAQAHADRLVREKIAGGYSEVGGEAMNDDVFWSLISLLDWRQAGDDEAVMAPLIRALTRRAVGDITAFDDLLAQKLFQIDGEAWGREIGEYAFRDDGGQFSQDLFLYARAAVIANGRDFFAAVVADPKQMPKDIEFEALLYAAQMAFEEKTGATYDHAAPTNIETFANWPQWPTVQRSGS
jgi:predicted DNA-binding WGR domain protein